LIHPDRENRPAFITDERFEDLESGAARRTYAAALNPSRHGHLLSRSQRRNSLKVAPVFIAERKPEEKIFDGRQPDSLKIGRSSRTDTFQVL
jgi:hypothetical protein